MLNRIDVYKYFLIAILLSTFLVYAARSGVVGYFLVILLMFSVIFVEIQASKQMNESDWLAIFIVLPYTILAATYYINKPFEGNYFSGHSLVIITLPIIILTLIRLRFYCKDFNYQKFTYKVILFFLMAELFICLGQISTFMTGVGLPINEEYRNYFMITGTFTNSNDLAAILLVIAFIFSGIEREFSTKAKFIVWLLIILLLLISGSRSAMLLTGVLFIYTRGFKLKDNFIYLFLLFIFFILYSFLFSEIENEVFSRFALRFQSLIDILTGGVSDYSMSVRIDSYMHFLSQLSSLGSGSGEVNNYYEYAVGANFNEQNLMFQNPHSLIVEIGYWLGWLGLLYFTILISYLLRYTNRKFLFVLIFLISSMISSSVLESVLYFYFIMHALIFSGNYHSSNSFNHRRKTVESKYN